MKLRRVLVANRGEIACRVMRTLRTLGIESAAVFSEPDADAPHVALADRAALIGPAPAVESYLVHEKVLAAARELECDAIHPGYGFLSENAAFARACRDAGIVFIGPPVEAIEKMGDKAAAREIAQAAGVSPVPGYEGPDDDATLAGEAERIGFPLLVKAVAGGGGKGMRRVDRAEDLAGAITAARREAQGAFGSGTLLLERYLRPVRHIEVQVLADGHGNVVPLLERECSLQRRHQKVVEECPSPVVDTAQRKRLGDAACRLAQAVGYEGAGTVEFLMEEDGSFWFLEMNTRLQVEHGVTELVTGEDLVAWQVRVAEGEALSEELAGLTPHGHAVEVRLYAEDPAAGFLPQAGRLELVVAPDGPGVRVDSGVRTGQEVSAHYDPMLMKIMAHGRDREEARQRLAAALRRTHLLGPATNLGYVLDILEEESFMSGATYTHTLEAAGPLVPPVLPDEVLQLAGWGLASGARGAGGAGGQDGTRVADPWAPFGLLGDFRIVEGGGSES